MKFKMILFDINNNFRHNDANKQTNEEFLEKV